MSAVPPRTRPYWPELDVLRGLAAVLMVYNHAGVRWPRGEGDALADALEFAGSLAPVVFFLVTGLGRGVQAESTSTRRPLGDTLRKVLLLLLADAALWLSPARTVGMDFLGFIAVSTLAVEVLARTARPQLVGLAALLAVLGARFVAAPLLRASAGGPLLFLLGDHPVDGFSYPPCPWLAYAILGFLLGGAAQRAQEKVRARRGAVTAGCALVGCALGAACVVLAARGHLFFRWGTVSVAYTVLSFASIGIAIAAAFQVSRVPILARALALPGTSSLVVVPVHYGLLDVALRVVPDLAGGGRFALAATALVVAALYLARAVDRILVRAVASRAGNALWLALLALALALLVVTYLSDVTPARLPCMIACQLVLCAMFALRVKK